MALSAWTPAKLQYMERLRACEEAGLLTRGKVQGEASAPALC